MPLEQRSSKCSRPARHSRAHRTLVLQLPTKTSQRTVKNDRWVTGSSRCREPVHSNQRWHGMGSSGADFLFLMLLATMTGWHFWTSAPHHHHHVWGHWPGQVTLPTCFFDWNFMKLCHTKPGMESVCACQLLHYSNLRVLTATRPICKYYANNFANRVIITLLLPPQQYYSHLQTNNEHKTHCQLNLLQMTVWNWEFHIWSYLHV